MSEPEAGLITFGPVEDITPTATIMRWAESEWPRLVRGQRVTTDGRQWRVTEVSTCPDGSETYDLLPAEVVDEAERAARLRP